MNIGIDGRLINETGVGRYIRNLVEQLAVLDTTNHYVIFLRRMSFDRFTVPNARWEKRLADVAWHSIAEQVAMPWILLRENLDLVHIPYFNVPIWYPKAFVVTIHDLTILHFHTGKATTLPFFLYQLRRFGYWLTLVLSLARAKKVIAVSGTTKQEIIDHFHIDPSRIAVMYEGVDSKMPNEKKQKRLIREPYFLYVGNAYPHKNLEMLLRAFQLFIQNNKQTTRLVLVGRDDFFYRRLRDTIKHMGLDGRVLLFGEADDQELMNLYTHTRALVLPSLMEGFGLPGVEAMALSTPVVCSDIPAFREVYQDACLLFDPKREEDIAAKLRAIGTDKPLRATLIARGKILASRYSWRRLAEETLRIYYQGKGQ